MTVFFVLFFFKQKTAYEMRISDWSSDVCSSDLIGNDDMACADPFADTGSDDADRAGAGDQYVLADHVELQRAMRGVAERIEECRSAERRVGKECVSKCRSRWSPSH